MSVPVPPAEARAFARTLADDLPWTLLDALQRGDARRDDLSAATGQPVTIISRALEQLAALGIVTSRASDADPAHVYYQLRVDQIRTLSQQLLIALHPTLILAEPVPSAPLTLARRPRVLFLCTENSARSQLAEGLLRQISRGMVEAASAGTQPGTVHPLVVELLGDVGQDLRAKHVDRFQGQPFDYVVTVCDRARETCPSFPGAERQAHWSIPDPAAAEPEAQRRAFTRTVTELSQRIRSLLIFIEREQRAAAMEVTR
ncbi:MAG: protein tyrosine phosphatase [Chloroflexales bacterium]|nr:protein tyrosine phosphatase [Chloroflexales bacterium]